MSGISSKDKWENKAFYDQAKIDAGRAQQQNISIEQLIKNDEAERLARMPDAVEPENQEAITEAMQAKLNEQYEAQAPEATTASQSLDSGSTGYDSGESEGESVEQAQETSGGWFDRVQGQEQDNGQDI